VIQEEFIKFESSINSEIQAVGELLSESMSDDPEGLISDLKTIESWNGRIGSLLAEANSFLDRSKMALKPARSDENTEFDRKCLLDGQTAPMRLLRDKLDSLSDAIKTRISLGQSILRYSTQFHEPTIKVPF